MKICLRCGGALGEPTWHCAKCSFAPSALGAYTAFAPSLADAERGFDARFYQQLASLEAGNFWFRARNELVLWALTRYFPGAGSLLEVGCGTGFVLGAIASAFPNLDVVGTEIHSEPLDVAARRAPGATLLQLDARAIPYRDEFDLACAFDVLEHIQEDRQVLKEMAKALRPGGGMVLTVPQHPFLWSVHDENAHHVRRYRREELRSKLSEAGFDVVRLTSFVSLLLPAMLLSRLLSGRNRQRNPFGEFELGTIANRTLEGILAVERVLIRGGLNFPAGGSLLAIARKRVQT